MAEVKIPVSRKYSHAVLITTKAIMPAMRRAKAVHIAMKRRRRRVNHFLNKKMI